MPKPLHSRTKPAEPSKPSRTIAPNDLPAELPLLPTRDLVLFPLASASLVVGREASAASIEQALLSPGRLIAVCLQKRADDDDPDKNGMHAVATVATVLRTGPLVDGRQKVVVQGLRRIRVQRMLSTSPS